MKQLFPRSFYNMTSLVGSAIAGFSLMLIIFLFILEAFDEHSKPYMGVITLVVLPIFMIGGLVLVGYGILREHRLIRHGQRSSLVLPVIDLHNPRHRTALVVGGIGTFLFLAVSAFGSFKVYEFTDSDKFCGEMCHSVMHPEYTAYQFSPHARVGCAQCHIGSGAEWFVKAKISGSYQVYSVLFNKYTRPIQTPIDNLRPAQQTCEQCHWPKHFFSEKERVFNYFTSNEQNSPWQLNLLIKIGGGNVDQGPTSGIHWHMNIANEITYAPADRSRQIIPWVKIKRPDGSQSIYRDTEMILSNDQLDLIEKRRMDCIDCHNRPTHIYNHPARSVNQFMAIGWIDPKLPYAKNICVKALQIDYSSPSVAADSIKTVITEFYENSYPEIAVSKKASIDRAVAEVQKIYSRNYFPEMKVSWKKFPDNIGHMYSAGCFRCHDGKHKSDDGKVLTRDCNACHTLLAQKFGDDKQRVSLQGIDYQHPVNVGAAWKEVNCSECHRQD